TSIGMDPIQAGIMMILNLIIGVITPPVGVCLFVAANIANISLVRISKAIFPFIVANIIVLMLVSFVPSMTLYLPRLILGH
ncbi:MAG: TRAP transporter large permease subunit, partial [Tepidanaerobacter sp.]|nr:TRAP transporter large permease subunit [Tepidanaerobacter sp.]